MAFKSIHPSLKRLASTHSINASRYGSLALWRTTLQDEATLTLTFAALKILSEHLSMALSAIEEELGPIRVPTAIRPTEQNKAIMIQALKATPVSE
jgi:hypothetical protein